jgi:phosphoribosyl 1,2-cyclic phosphodiesterase
VQFGSITRRIVLLDAGLSPRRVREGLLHRCPPGTELGAILLTHLDGDHWHRGWSAQLARRGVPVLLRAAHYAGALALGIPRACLHVVEGEASLGEHLRVRAVRTPHDEHGSTAFIIDTPAGRIGWATDLGSVHDELVEALTGVDLLGLECNYDEALQRESPRPWHLKQRIMGGHGHLSNDQAMDALDRIRAVADPAAIGLLHLSRDCNCPHLVSRLLASRHTDLAARTVIARRSEPSPALRFTRSNEPQAPAGHPAPAHAWPATRVPA